MNVALVQLPHFFGDGLSREPINYPLGLGYLSAVLSRKGIPHAGINLWEKQWSAAQALENVDFSRFDFVGISAYSTQYRYFKEFVTGLKARHPGLPLICGGPGPTFSAKVLLEKTPVDVCVIGEGEETLLELLERPGRWDTVAGVALRREGGVLFTPAREQIRDLDALPFPDRDIFDLRAIMARKRGIEQGKSFVQVDLSWRNGADIIAGRGCPYQCRFCSRTFHSVRLRSIDAILREVEELVGRYGVNFLQFADELVLVNKRRTLELCARLKGMGLRWAAQGRIDQVDEEIVRALKESGCTELGFGVESVSQEILDAMKKKLRAERIVPAIRMTREAGITPVVQYMFGYPGENDETIRRTKEFFVEMDLPFVGFTTTPIPGTPLYQDCLDKGVIRDEEDYLLRLDSGYNVHGAMINLTGFSDEEFARRKKLLQWEITHHYLKKRPRQYAEYLLQVLRRRGRWALDKVLPAALRGAPR